jgi:hypothetical protein
VHTALTDGDGVNGRGAEVETVQARANDKKGSDNVFKSRGERGSWWRQGRQRGREPVGATEVGGDPVAGRGACGAGGLGQH